MGAVTIERIELLIDAGAAALLAAACAHALSSVASPLAGTAAAAGLVFAVGLRGLRAIPAEERPLPLPAFEPPSADFEATDELVLTDADRLVEAPADELLLEDVLAELGPDSRVVRLFDRSAMPTPGELKARIDRHLNADVRPTEPADAAQALHDALAELRRSLN